MLPATALFKPQLRTVFWAASYRSQQADSFANDLTCARIRHIVGPCMNILSTEIMLSDEHRSDRSPSKLLDLLMQCTYGRNAMWVHVQRNQPRRRGAIAAAMGLDSAVSQLQRPKLNILLPITSP